MYMALLFLNLQLLERVFSLDVGYLKIGPGELFILIFLFYRLIVKKSATIPKDFLLVAFGFFAIILAGLISNAALYGVNSMITIPARILVVGVICSDLAKTRYSRTAAFVTNFNIFIFFLLLIFLSGVLPIAYAELFNRNELMAYTSALLALRVVNLSKVGAQRVVSWASLFWLTAGCLLFMAFVGQSRQALIASAIMIFVIYIVTSKNNVALLGRVVIGSLFIATLFLAISNITLDGYQGARLQTLQTFEPATSADRQRLANIFQGIEGARDKPIFGNGATSFIRNNEFKKVAHNTYVSTVYEFGVVGLLVLIGILLRMLKPMFINKVSINFQRAALVVGGLSVYFMAQIVFIESYAKAPIYILMMCSFYILHRSKDLSGRDGKGVGF